MRCLTVGTPAGFFPLLGDLPPGIDFDTVMSGEYAWAMIFVRQTQELIETIPVVLPQLVEDGLLWVTFIKRSSRRTTDLTRESLWNIMHSHGYKAVTHIYIDPDWTAMRFRKLELIGR